MNISEEIKERLKLDQVAARHVIFFTMRVYKDTFPDIAAKLECTEKELTDWVLHRHEIPREICWKIFQFAGDNHIPLEWEIRGELLKEYDPELIVILARELIKTVGKRFKEEGELNSKGDKQLSIVILSGTLSIYQFGSTPGNFKLGLSCRVIRDDFQMSIHRIDDEEVQIGTGLTLTLPKIPAALTRSNLGFYDHHQDHSFTYRDYMQILEIVRDGKVVDNSYFLEAHLRPFTRENITRRRKQEA